MDKQSLPVRVFAAGLPLIVIALIFGAVGYVTKEAETAAIPSLPAADPGVRAAQGEIAGIAGNQITVLSETGTPATYTLSPDAPIEFLAPINLAAVELGDWLNGGAIPHPDTLLALVSLVLLPQPVTP